MYTDHQLARLSRMLREQDHEQGVFQALDHPDAPVYGLPLCRQGELEHFGVLHHHLYIGSGAA
ncbi:hypothetical protein EXIGUO8H_320006 [Exiguobacterium sp. 8H]|uniref:hypothetical protein n=1 Tax=Exiguobacterium sp. 8H TaxID=2653140 RepID=UPI0012F3DB60|nr:hypothetical protein [Exiguobacterium sp. 8H]VXB82721.1 hypothetical protein EXIGUO8H_320006 [Exiguobacterium sp. 8H]